MNSGRYRIELNASTMSDRSGLALLGHAQHRRAPAGTSSPLEEFVASGHLRVTGILDLEPVGACAVRMVATARELAHDAVKVVRARHLEKSLRILTD